MRSLEECRDEVFRRTEKRIQKRRKMRRRVIACCIPLCLCMAVWTATILLGGNEKCAPFEQNEAGAPLGASYVKLEIRMGEAGTDQREVITDPAEVGHIYEMLMHLCSGEQDDSESYHDHAENASADAKRYRITFFTPEGGELCFLLNGQLLTNASTGEGVLLSPTQLSQVEEWIYKAE